MLRKVLILGAYGTFGKRIAKSLAKSNIPIIITGRDRLKIEALNAEIRKSFINPAIETALIDIDDNLAVHLQKLQPFIVINTCGPFQKSLYKVAQACIQDAIHYIDLADDREFVKGINAFEEQAKSKNIYVVSGASTVPALSSAVIDYYKKNFSIIETIKYGISLGQKTDRGLATTRSILSYVGKPLKAFPDSKRKIYGWQNIYRQNYPVLGKRWMANCDIPDLDLFPSRYGAKKIQFSAGMESSVVHLGMWLLSWWVRMGLPINLPDHAKFLLKLSHQFDRFGSADGGMHVIMSGADIHNKPLQITWFLIAKNNDGLEIPTIPAIILAKKIIHNEINEWGARPCVGLLSLDEYLAELDEFDVETYTDYR